MTKFEQGAVINIDSAFTHWNGTHGEHAVTVFGFDLYDAGGLWIADGVSGTVRDERTGETWQYTNAWYGWHMVPVHKLYEALLPGNNIIW